MTSQSERFESYEERFPFESNYLNSEEPRFQIERIAPNTPDRVRIHSQVSALASYLHAARTYQVIELWLELDKAEIEIDFSKFSKPSIIEMIYMFCPGTAPAASKTTVFNNLQLLRNLRKLSLSTTPNLFDIRKFFPLLENISMSTDDLPCENLQAFWPNLRLARIDNVKGELNKIGPLEHLKELRLYAASLTGLEKIAELYPNLEVLIIHGQRKPLDVSTLAKCKKLKFLKFDAFTKTVGVDTLRIPSLEMMYFTKLESSSFLDLNPQLEYARVKKFAATPSQSMLDRGWSKVYGGEQGIGGDVVPKPLRK